MKYNSNYYDKLDPLCCEVCEETKCKCPETCGEIAKAEWEEYMQKEACKPEEFEPFNPCDYDPNGIYFMQYRSKNAVYDEDIIEKGIYHKFYDYMKNLK